MKKRFTLTVALIIAVLVFPILLTACNSSGNISIGSKNADETLIVYNWEDYIDPATITAFENYYLKITGKSIAVTYTTFDTNETMMTKVLKGDAHVDLIAPSEYSIEKLMRAGALRNVSEMTDGVASDFKNKFGRDLPIEGVGEDRALLSNTEPEIVAKIAEIFTEIPIGNKIVSMLDYMVPYMYGTLGILYNTKYVSEKELEEYGWRILWNEGNNDKLEDKILMKDSIRDSYAAAVLYLKETDKLPAGNSSKGLPYPELSIGDLINCTDKALLDAAEEALVKQREHISGYEVDFGKDDMINEIVYLDLAWSGDALWAIEEGGYDEETDTYQLGYYVPEIGANIWYDGWVVPDTVKNELAAVMFIDFMNRPEYAVQNSIYIGYTSAVSKEKMMKDVAVAALLKKNEYGFDEYFDDVGRYPFNDADMLPKLGVMQDFGSANESAVQMWESVKVGTAVPTVLIWCLVAVACAGALIAGAYFLKERLKRRPRKIIRTDSDER